MPVENDGRNPQSCTSSLRDRRNYKTSQHCGIQLINMHLHPWSGGRCKCIFMPVENDGRNPQSRTSSLRDRRNYKTSQHCAIQLINMHLHPWSGGRCKCIFMPVENDGRNPQNCTSSLNDEMYQIYHSNNELMSMFKNKENNYCMGGTSNQIRHTLLPLQFSKSPSNQSNIQTQ